MKIVSVIFSVMVFAGPLFSQGNSADDFGESQDGYSSELEIELAKCSRSSQCFSNEYCSSAGQCVDSYRTPCQSNSDCVAGESCNRSYTPHKCR